MIAGQLIASMLLSVLFLAMYGHPGRYGDREMAWFIAALVWAGVLLDGLLLAAVFGVQVPLGLAVAVLAAQDIVVGWRLWLLLRARHLLGEGYRPSKHHGDRTGSLK